MQATEVPVGSVVAEPDGKGDPNEAAVAVVDDEDKVVMVEKDGSEDGEEEEDKAEPISFFQLMATGDPFDWLLMVLGGICGTATGVALPLFAILLGGMYDDFQGATTDQAIYDAGDKYGRLFAYVAAGSFVAGFGQVAFPTMAADRITLKLRKLYLDAILSQEIGWFDTCGSGKLSSSIAENTVIIRDGLGEKFGALFQFFSMFTTGLIVGFIYSWQLTLTICAGAPLLAIGGALMMKFMAEATSQGLGAYAAAGAVAEEAFTMIRTISSLGIEDRTSRRYKKELLVAEAEGIKKGKVTGIGMGWTFGVYFMMYALAYYVGSVLVLNSRDDAADAYWPDPPVDPRCHINYTVTESDVVAMNCVSNGQYNFQFETRADVCQCEICDCGCFASGASCLSGGDITAAFFSVVIGAFSLGQAAPSITALVSALAAAGTIFKILKREPEIDLTSDEGEKLDDTFSADISLKNVTFRYPARTDQTVFDGLNLEIKAGQTVALVGGSGSGKSTIVQLVQRFYDPEQGSISIGGKDIRELNLRSMRDHIGLVGQEPVLFATSIRENIAYGARDGVVPTDEDIENAARSSNAYDFIMDFPDKFDTFCGEGGSSLSGGQKQRIAIARAILRNPKILILDEATSALDNASERIVQKALDDIVSKGTKSSSGQLQAHTTLVIAHRLSTVRNADMICVIGSGKVVEKGTHEELLQVENGHYAALVAAATKSQESGEEVDLTALLNQDERLGSSQMLRSSRSKSKSHMPEEDEDESDDESDFEEREESFSKSKSEIIGVDEAVVTTSCCGLRKRKGKKKKKKQYKVSLRRVFKFSAPEKKIYIPAVSAALINGAVMPAFGLLFSGLSLTFFYPTETLIKEKVRNYCLGFVGLGVLVGIAYLVQFWTFGIIGERMTTRVRHALFKALLSQEVSYYDRKSNSVGALTSKLATDSALVKAAVADRLSLGVMNLTTVVVALVLALTKGAALAGVLIALMPLIVIAGAVQMMMMAGMAGEDDKALSGAGQILTESILGIRTVTAFNLREKVVDLYSKFLEEPLKMAQRKGLVAGVGFGFSQAAMFGIYAVAFVVGSRFMVSDPETYTFQTVMEVFFVVVMAGFGVGQSMAMAPDVGKGSAAVSSVFRVLDRKSKVDPFTDKGLKGENAKTRDISFKEVDFTYPTREGKIFDKLNLDIKAGDSVALVGQSGSGKSTCVALLERFYDPDGGAIEFHGIDTKKVNPKWLRSKIGFVQQEPQLFKTTIFENIALGVPELEKRTSDDDENVELLVTEEQVIAAAKAANAHDFIMELPDKYQTVIQKGSLSGGQKQRICIARAIVSPRELFLFDEASSALDEKSQRQVQNAIDQLMAANPDTTSITIAHRLSTIQNSSKICVVSYGKIVEQGTHEELMAMDGAYTALFKAQQQSSDE